MPRIARCEKCLIECDLEVVFLGDAMPKGWYMFRNEVGTVLCPKHYNEYKEFFKKVK